VATSAGKKKVWRLVPLIKIIVVHSTEKDIFVAGWSG
jgi:hypothetical protein